MCPDSKIIEKYSCKRTKTTAIIQTLAEASQEEIVRNAVRSAFSIATDGSHHAGEETLYLIVVTAYRSDLGEIVPEVLALPVCVMSNTGENIFKLLNEELHNKGLSWSNCICFATDNCSTMTGLHKGTAAFITKENPNIFVQGCACHLIHIAAQKATKELPVSIEDLLIDLYYYLEKSALRHQKLKQCQVLCDAATHKILKHTSTRWLSLKNCVDRLLEQWPTLQTFILGDKTLPAGRSNVNVARVSAVSVSPFDSAGNNCTPKYVSTPTPVSSSKLVASVTSTSSNQLGMCPKSKTSEPTKLISKEKIASHKSSSSQVSLLNQVNARNMVQPMTDQ
ncbi:zinc finger MYM-type protein 6-like isoform X3 [Bacillus rossius redtenbacheri]|uniref:zinc finger MYM-type protein 6-like isoform X3 n=1 Tax=Bacillus rossius redtenbacheri TaxID=93214 RepID=UPI002FDEEC81